MKPQINKIISLLLKELDFYSEEDVYKISTYITILYTLLSCQTKSIMKDCLTEAPLYTSLRTNFSDLTSLFEGIHNNISQATENEIRELLLSIYNKSLMNDEFIISDFYQQVKSHMLRQLNATNVGYLAKKQGKHMLYATQFFTDTYMVEYLVNQVLSLYKDIDNILFVDPASGGGNFLTYLYRKLYQKYINQGEGNNASCLIFANNLLGFDLDYELSRIATLSLYILSYKTSGELESGDIYNFGGVYDDVYGTLVNKVKSVSINGKSYNDILSKAKDSGKKIVFITNPPFMGRRDMDTDVKDFLLKSYPSAKGDLCFSFMLHLLEHLKEDDTLAIVAQNGWLNLSSLKSLRKIVVENAYLRNCIDLGSNAFKNINGEKTNVVLAIFQQKNDGNKNMPTHFVNLRTQSIEDKALSLKNHLYKEYDVVTTDFLKNKSFEFNYQLGDDLVTLNKYKQYGRFAKCMQGSSTGDNTTMVKYIWETNATDWVLASKGGGFCKWQGLNYYKVKWGKKGECIKNNKGGVLRNPSLIPLTKLVYSDTGTLGLNVRCKVDNQVFIASGPGIYILSGDMLCHMAFLNSKMASFFMRIINPKFTLSGGYIQKLPVADGILDNKEISSLAILCIELKQRYLETKLPNLEFRHDVYDTIDDVNQYIVNVLKQDFLNMYERLVAERMIDTIIENSYQLSDRLMIEYKQQMSGFQNHVDNNISIHTLDNVLSRLIGDNCMLLGKKIDGKLIGSENCIEILSYQTGVSCSAIIAKLIPNITKLHDVIKIYRNDFLHKIILSLCGIEDLNDVGNTISISSKDILDNLRLRYPHIAEQLNICKFDIETIIGNVHTKVFFNHPIIILE